MIAPHVIQPGVTMRVKGVEVNITFTLANAIKLRQWANQGATVDDEEMSYVRDLDQQALAAFNKLSHDERLEFGVLMGPDPLTPHLIEYFQGDVVYAE